jgi:hypothetical protein
MVLAADVPQREYCRRCKSRTNHFTLEGETIRWQDPDDPYIEGLNKYDIIKCVGCEEVSFRLTKYNSEEVDDQGRPAPEIKYYPPLALVRPPRWLDKVEGKLRPKYRVLTRLLRQALFAFDENLYELAVMGLRACLDIIITKKVGDNGTFQEKLHKAFAAGLISKNDIKRLGIYFQLGSASIHRGFSPSSEQTKYFLEVIQTLFENLILSNEKSRLVEKQIPKRRKRKRKT